jgi:hypothetical protein
LVTLLDLRENLMLLAVRSIVPSHMRLATAREEDKHHGWPGPYVVATCMGLILHNDVKKLAPNVCTGKAEGAQSSQAVVAIRDGVGVE